jgi:hypothetical protein
MPYLDPELLADKKKKTQVEKLCLPNPEEPLDVRPIAEKLKTRLKQVLALQPAEGAVEFVDPDAPAAE